MPILGASTSGMSAYNNAITEEDFCRATLVGCRQAGTLSLRGDTFFDPEDETHDTLRAIADEGGQGVPALGVDFDGDGSTNFARAGKAVFRKTVAEIRQPVGATGPPFVAKGILHPDDALKMLALGARAGIGAGSEGVRLQMDHHAKVFRQAMRMTGCRTLADIGPSVLA